MKEPVGVFEPAPPNVAAGCERGTEEMEVGRMVWGGLLGAQDSWGMGGSGASGQVRRGLNGDSGRLGKHRLA